MKYFVSLVCCFFATAANGASCDRSTDIEVIRGCYLRTLDCAALTNSSDRLTCYDRIYQQSRRFSDPLLKTGSEGVATVGSEKIIIEPQQLVPVETPVTVVIEPMKTPDNQVGIEENEVATSNTREPVEISDQLVAAQTPAAVVISRAKTMDNRVGIEDNEAATKTDATVVIESARTADNQVTSDEENEAITDVGEPAIIARIVALKKNLHGEMTITLSNEQVWRELDLSRLRYKIGDEVVIRGGIFRSHKLRISGQGLSSQVKPIKGNPAEITARIVGLRQHPSGDMTITLSNDQVWRDSDPSRLDYKVGEKVVIRKGIFRSHKLYNGQGRSSKVRRIR